MPLFILLGASFSLFAFITTRLIAWRTRPSAGARWVAAANLLFVLINCVAPFRALLDPHYPGYSNGLVTLHGVTVTFVAGFFALGAAMAAFIAVGVKRGRPLYFVAAFDAILLINTLGGLLRELMTANDFRIEFGEYLRIPSAIGFVVMLLLFVTPLAASVRWSARAAMD